MVGFSSSKAFLQTPHYSLWLLTLLVLCNTHTCCNTTQPHKLSMNNWITINRKWAAATRPLPDIFQLPQTCSAWRRGLMEVVRRSTVLHVFTNCKVCVWLCMCAKRWEYGDMHVMSAWNLKSGPRSGLFSEIQTFGITTQLGIVAQLKQKLYCCGCRNKTLYWQWHSRIQDD